MTMPGNSMLFACFLWLVHGGSLVRSFRIGTDIPHWIVVSWDGTIRHFEPTRDLLDPPLSHLLYMGKFEKIEA